MEHIGTSKVKLMNYSVFSPSSIPSLRLALPPQSSAPYNCRADLCGGPDFDTITYRILEIGALIIPSSVVRKQYLLSGSQKFRKISAFCRIT